MSALLLFGSTFVLVFLLGLQSQFVNRGRALPAFFMSFAIGASNLVMFKLVPDANAAETVAYLSGGPIGIVCAIHFFTWLNRHNKKEIK